MQYLDITVEDPRWDALDFEALTLRAVMTTLEALGLEAEIAEISLLGCDDARISVLNAEFRGKPAATNVLSWPAQPLAPPAEGVAPPQPERGFDGMFELGDIALSHDTCAREALESGKPFEDHLTHLIVHGVLHLLGYDHICDGDAALMEGIEAEILGNLGLDDPYSAGSMLTGAP